MSICQRDLKEDKAERDLEKEMDKGRNKKKRKLMKVKSNDLEVESDQVAKREMANSKIIKILET